MYMYTLLAHFQCIAGTSPDNWGISNSRLCSALLTIHSQQVRCTNGLIGAWIAATPLVTDELGYYCPFVDICQSLSGVSVLCVLVAAYACIVVTRLVSVSKQFLPKHSPPRQSHHTNSTTFSVCRQHLDSGLACQFLPVPNHCLLQTELA
ncbi:unnamed protein product [Protopolystoma xenopodis]|uniref:Uncharacterized protein n=1 Tax=Protopolystoma xenopodis TaxID=117903 RepID=A0A448WM61_9PLAT|nr:unnamed protein product [Protopolystoma xenopodis]